MSLLVVEPVIRAALVVEDARAHASGEQHEEVFSRPVQVVGGLLTAVLVGLALGVVFAVVFARARHRLPGGGDFGRALVLAAAGFGVLALLPSVKYPASPPGVGDPETVGARTLLYLTLLAAGILVLLAVTVIAAALARRGWRHPERVSAAAAAGALLFVAVLALWPATPDTVPPDIPAELLWRFRLASLAQLAALWATLGLVTGLLLERAGRAQQGSSTPAAATSG
ncbi:MAG: CbtA family protein [Actinomycetota bacterium]|nr:CbtA family protein [Actinomycetota bacterium]